MAENTGIEWCDHTWTPVVGCDAVSPACAKCYAALMAARLEAMGMEKYAGLATRVGNIGKWTGKVTLWEPDLVKPLKVKKPSRWFLTSMGDIFHKLVPDTFLDRAFDVMSQTPRHTYYVLTKRDERAAAYIAGRAPLPNVIVGCTAENQEQADLRRRSMAAITAMGWQTFVSYEPALGAVGWTGWEFLSWLISGGESGYDARPSHPDWHRAARDFCSAHGIAYLFKQWGEWLPDYETAERPEDNPEQSRFRTCVWNDDTQCFDETNGHWADDDSWFIADSYSEPEQPMTRYGKKAAGRLLDGIEHNEFPNVAA